MENIRTLEEMERGEKEKVILVALNVTNIKYGDKDTNKIDIYDQMEELEELSEADNLEVMGKIIQNKDTYDSAFYIGKGKAQELKELCESLDVTTVIFNEELSGIQIKNLESLTNVNVIDRTVLILDIFAKRALSREGKYEVELAQLKYRLSRLIGLGSDLSRLGGGIGTRGPGEKKLETDKRHIRRRIDEIKTRLKEISKNRETNRVKREKGNLKIAALVGYTNSGKSTILNEIIKTHKDYTKDKEVLVKNMLFATLDVNLRKATLPSNTDFLITDTVGFVSNIPTDLIEAFKATLEEVKYANLLIHVVDLSNEKYKLQIDTTNEILKELGCENKKMIYVFNKADKTNYESSISVDEPYVVISATKKYNLLKLYELIEKNLIGERKQVTMVLPFNNLNILSKLKEKYSFNEEYIENGAKIELKMDPEDINRYNEFIINS